MRTYVVWCPDLGQEQEDGATIPATDPADAAEGWAEWHDRSSAEYRIASGREEIVIVRDVETGEQREWIVRGEAMPYYTAQPGESATIRAQVAPGRWAEVRDCGSGDVGANARLIAAAPELLAALVELRDWYTEHTGLPAVAANAAIAKAVQPNAKDHRLRYSAFPWSDVLDWR